MAQAARHLGAHAFDERRIGWLGLIVGVVLAVGVLMIAGGLEFTGSPAMTNPNMTP